MSAAPPIDRPSPNAGPRAAGTPVDMLVVHYTEMASAAAALDWLCDPAARVSAHYLIAEDGTVHALVPEHRRAWHAGVSAWRGITDVNAHSIGIELDNPGHGGCARSGRGFRPRRKAALSPTHPGRTGCPGSLIAP